MSRFGAMRPTGRGGVALLVTTSALMAVPALSADRPNFNQARAVFERLPARDRNEAFLELMATGDFVAMASDQFGTRLYDATTSFQEQHGIPPSGVLTPETREALSTVGGTIFNSWGLEFLDHPFASAAVVVPGNFGLESKATAHGVAMENRRQTISVSFAFFGDGEATLQTVFDNLTRATPGRHVDLQVIRPEFLAVASGTETSGSYSRYIPVPGGIAGFTLSWNSRAFPNAGRIAIVMANELYARRMVGGDMFASLPGGASPISQGADDASVEHQREAQEAVQRQAQQQAELDRQQAQQRYLDQVRQQHEDAERRKAAEQAALQAAEERARVLRQAEIDREAKVEAARQVAAEKLKADRLAAAKASADPALKDASDFVKANRDDPKLMDILQRITDLKVASGGTDPDPINRTRSEMQAGLGGDPAYTAWEAQQIAERQRETETTLRQVVQVLAIQRKFLVDRVADDPTASYAIAFLPLAKQAEAAIASPSLDGAQSLMGLIDNAIEKAGLHDSYALAKTDAAKLQSTDIVSSKDIGSPIKP